MTQEQEGHHHRPVEDDERRCWERRGADAAPMGHCCPGYQEALRPAHPLATCLHAGLPQRT